jgi:hypothetical protein
LEELKQPQLVLDPWPDRIDEFASDEVVDGEQMVIDLLQQLVIVAQDQILRILVTGDHKRVGPPEGLDGLDLLL